MEAALAKIRPHTSSGLAHQKTPATLLVALESTFSEQKADPTSTAYFAALLTTLDGTLQKKNILLGDGDVLPAELYLLALVLPFVPQPVIRSNLSTVLALTAPLFPLINTSSPALRSQISIYQAVFSALDKTQLEVEGIRQVFASILQLCLDQRPKVRKKAADVIHSILVTPPAPLVRHPYAERVAEWIKTGLQAINQTPLSKSQPGKTEISADAGIHILAFIRPILRHLPPSSFPDITNLLLVLPRLGNQYLSQSTYSVLSALLALSDEDDPTFSNNEIPAILSAILSSPPSKFDATLSPAWIGVLGNAMLALSLIDADASTKELGRVWKTIWPFLEANEAVTRRAAADSLDSLTRCISKSILSSPVSENSTLGKILSQTSKALESITYARAIPEVLSVISSLLLNITHTLSTPATHQLVLPLVQQVGMLRTQKNFEFKELADATLGAAIRALGPDVVLGVLPLNLEPHDREAGREPRAFLLPLLAQDHPAPLSHFVSYFVPLSERMFDLQQKAEMEDRPSEAKVWTVLVAQIWSGFAGYCNGAADVKESLTPQFSQLLSQLLYAQPELRPAVLKGLKTLVDSNKSIAEGQGTKVKAVRTTPEKAAENIAFLRTQSESWLAVFFNVYGSIGTDGRNLVGGTITSWSAISGEQEITRAYAKVIQLFKANLGKPNPSTPEANVTVATLDLLLILLPYLSPSDSTILWDICLTQPVLSAKDNAIQKRGYKILSRIVESGKVSFQVGAILKQLDELTDQLAPAAKKDRFTLLTALVPSIPSADLHLIVSLIPEAVLGTKEPSDKARSAAFDLTLAMGKRMKEGGVVRKSEMDGMDQDDDASDSKATIEEFMTMIAGGLAGASPHMISATVTAISRLVFEFKDDISLKMQTDILSTLLVFLSSANREIVKSILGFVKLAIHTFPVDVVRPHLKEIVPGLLSWSHDHKNHFKVKVRHIFERMLRRFGWDEVYGCAGDEEASKVLTNIKKRKERAKRKKAERADDDDADEAPKAATGDAFEDVLYGSESELDDSEDEITDKPAPLKGKKKQIGNARLRMDGDNPIDLLQGAATQVTNASGRRRKPGQDAAKFKTDEDTGKMIIDDSDHEGEDAATGVHNPAGSAYLESMTSVDGFTRGPNGRVKFNKDTKKRRREELEADVEMGDETVAPKNKRPKEKKEPVFGHEYKAKKAGGDLKKGGLDPFAYLTLSQAAKKSSKKQRIGVTKKR